MNRCHASLWGGGTLLLAVLLGVVPGQRAEALLAAHNCSFCHAAHHAAGETLLDSAVVETLCLTCHGPGGIAALRADVHTDSVTAPTFRHSCRDCHDPHDNLPNWLGGMNIKLTGTIQDATRLAMIATPNSGLRTVIFENRTSFVQGAPSYDGVCETCHTLTAFHRNNPSGTHNHKLGTTCTTCHDHANYFLPR